MADNGGYVRVVHYERDTREIHHTLSVGCIYFSSEYGDVMYVGRSMSDGKLEFMTQVEPKLNRRKLRYTKEKYKADITAKGDK